MKQERRQQHQSWRTHHCCLLQIEVRQSKGLRIAILPRDRLHLSGAVSSVESDCEDQYRKLTNEGSAALSGHFRHNLGGGEIGIIVLDNVVGFLVAICAQHCGGHVGNIALADLVHQGLDIRQAEGSN